jgi:glyoxylase-like metal-dependent hydrolase (beta-lactamase superfamily II)
MPIGRRNLLVLAMTAIAGGAAGPAAASQKTEQAQAPGFYRFKVGRFLVTLVNDGAGTRPLDGSFIANAPLSDVQAALEAVRQPTTAITIPFTTTLIDDGEQLVLIDAGNGEFGPQAGLWQRNLAAAGYSPEQVDVLIASHFHSDHIQGIRLKDGRPAFPNARLLAPEAEWGFWMDESRMANAQAAHKGRFEIVHRVFAPEQGRVELFAGEKEILPGLMTLPAPGHTPGHTAFILSDGDERLLIWSDTTNKPELFVRHPSWQAAFDMDGELATGTRLRLLDMAAADRLRVVGYHFPFPANGWIVKEGAGYDYVPIFWSPTL